MKFYWICTDCDSENLYPETTECETCGKQISEVEIKKVEKEIQKIEKQKKIEERAQRINNIFKLIGKSLKVIKISFLILIGLCVLLSGYQIYSNYDNLEFNFIIENLTDNVKEELASHNDDKHGLSIDIVDKLDRFIQNIMIESDSKKGMKFYLLKKQINETFDGFNPTENFARNLEYWLSFFKNLFE